MPLSRVRLVSTLVVSGIGALLRHLFRTGYYPKEWPLKLSLIMGITKGMFGLLSFTTIEESQEMTCKDHTPAATKDAWLVEVAIPKNEDTAKDTLAVLNTALAKLDPDIKGLELNVDDVNNDLTAEWTAAKSEATLKETVDDLSLSDKFQKLSDDTESDVVILYCHGGYMLCDPRSHRTLCYTIAKKGKCRVLSLRYRLAPQSRWPKQLLDTLLAYSYLLNPPKSSPHQPISPSQIIFAGDSAGGNIILGTLLSILSSANSHFPPPAGIITLCGLFDSSFSFGMQSSSQSPWDPTVNPHEHPLLWQPSAAIPELSYDTAHAYLPRLEVAMHPLASPVLCPDEMLKEFPPMLMFVSDSELLYKESMYFARRARLMGQKVRLFVHEIMPHVFQMHPFPGIQSIQESWNEIEKFIQDIAQEKDIVPIAETLKFDGTRITITEEDYPVKIEPEEVTLRQKHADNGCVKI